MTTGMPYTEESKKLIKQNRSEFKNPDRMLDDSDPYPLQPCKKCGHLMRNDVSPEGRTHHCPECYGYVRMPTQEEDHDMAAIFRLRAEKDSEEKGEEE